MRNILYNFKSSGKQLLSQSGQIVLETHVTSHVKSVFANYFSVCASHYYTAKTIILL
jgi:hypothetical protein